MNGVGRSFDHVVQDEEAPRAKRFNRAVEALELSRRSIGEDEVERPKLGHQGERVAEDETNILRPRLARETPVKVAVPLDAHDLHVRARGESFEDPGKPDARPGPQFKDPPASSGSGRQDREQSADVIIARHLESGGLGAPMGGQPLAREPPWGWREDLRERRHALHEGST